MNEPLALRDCWWPSDTWSQGIIRFGIDLVVWGMRGRINTFVCTWASNWQWASVSSDEAWRLFGTKPLSETTRWVDGTPTTEVTPVTIWWIYIPDLGHQMVTIMVMNDLLPPSFAMSIGPPILRYSYLKIWPLKSMVKVMCVVKGQGHIWPSAFKRQGHCQGQTIGYIWDLLEFNRYVCFSFCGNRAPNRASFGWDIANFIFDLENSRSRSWPRSNLMVTVEALSSIDFFFFRFVAIGPFFGWDIANSIFDLENSRSRSWPRSNPMVTFEP